MTIFVRTSRDEPFTPRCVGPLADNHTLVDEEECPGCGYAFAPGDHVALLAVGPGGDLDAREKCAAGRWYNAVAVACHPECMGLVAPAPDAREAGR